VTAGRRADRTDGSTKQHPGRPRGPRSQPASRRHPERWVVGSLLIFAAVAIGYALASAGVYQDDDLDHFFMARAALKNPEFFLNPWGRPAFTIVYALPAQFGFKAARLFTVVIAVLTGWLAARSARAMGFKHAWAAAPLTVWQPTFFMLSFSALVEPLGALLIAAILDGHARKSDTQTAIAAGLLPLARLELIGVSAAVGVLLLARRNWKAIVWIALPMVLWGLAGALAKGDPLWLLNAVTGSSRPLRTSGPMQYIRNDIVVVGPAAFLGFFLGLAVLFTPGPGPKPWFAAAVWGLVFVTLTALTWEKLKLGGSIGFLRHLIVLAPAVALLALAGYEGVVKDMPPARRWALFGVAVGLPVLVFFFLSHKLEWDYFVRPGRDWSRVIGMIAPAAVAMIATGAPAVFARWKRPALPVVVACLAAAAFCVSMLRPIPISGEQKAVKLVADFIRQNGFYVGRTVMANHPWFYEMTGRDRWNRALTPYVTRANVESARQGSIIVWDSHYGDRLYGDITLDELLNDPRYRRIAEAVTEEAEVRVVAFERIAG
jgi:hypothetical protein